MTSPLKEMVRQVIHTHSSLCCTLRNTTCIGTSSLYIQVQYTWPFSLGSTNLVTTAEAGSSDVVVINIQS